MNLWKSHKVLRYVVVLTAVVAVATIGYVATAGKAEAQSADQELQTATARRGELSLIASGSGTLIPAAEVDLGFEVGGEIDEILVEVGDEVAAGEVLARLDPTSAEAALAEAETALRELTSPLAVARARIAAADAQEALETAQRTYTVQQGGNRGTSETVKAAQAKVAVARDRMEQAKSAYDHAPGKLSEGGAKAQAYLAYVNARNAYYTALASYNWYTGHPTDIQQTQLEADVALAQATLGEAEALLASLIGAEMPQAAFGEGLTALENARNAVEEARRKLEAAELRAPMAGTITAVNATVGETVGESPVMTLMDLDTPHVEFYLDQADIDKALEGLAVEVVFDAYPDAVYTGMVTAIDPVLTTSGGVSAVHGFAELTPHEGEGAPRLLVGLSAAVDVIAGRVENAVLIPVEALREITPGKYAVFAVDSAGELALRMVEVGLQDETFAAIDSGLEAGEIVSTGIVEVGP